MQEPFFYFLVRAWNAFAYFERCVDSILKQEATNYKILYIDDASDYSSSQRKFIREKLKHHVIHFNKERKFSIRNAYDAIHTYINNDSSIIINLDGDDWLIRNDVLSIVSNVYLRTGCDFTYGNCIIYNPGDSRHLQSVTNFDKFANQKYSAETRKFHKYRTEIFLPLHLRTWKTHLFKKIPKKYFQYESGNWIRLCEDQAIFYALFDLSSRYSIIRTPLSAYNKENKLSDEKINLSQRLYDELYIRKKKSIKSFPFNL